MGLDLVETILAVEDKFRIHISDEEASEAVTVGMLHELILGKVGLRDTQHCLTSAAFYRVRRACTEVLGVDRRQIRPDTCLETLLPIAGRRETWARIQAAIQLEAPELRHPLGRVMARYAVEFPHGVHTVGGLATDILHRNYAALAEASGGWNRKEVYEILCGIIIEHAGVRRSDLTPEARFAEDLRID